MEIISGLFNHMVMQRDKNGLSNQLMVGVCKEALTAPIRISVFKNKKIIKGFSAIKAGSAVRGKFAATLKGLPAGGPYDIQLSCGVDDKNETLTIQNVLVGDVWILAGQSNMHGTGLRKDRLKPDPLVRAFYNDDRWDVAEDPLHDFTNAVDAVHGRGGHAPHIGTGPGVAFAQSLLKLTGIPQGLIACAHGGTSMAQWSPALKSKKGASLYGAMYRRFVKNGSRVAGVFWYQGCSDTGPDTIDVYTEKMVTLIKSMRRDFENKSLPFVLVQIARTILCETPTCWNSIREQQRLLPEKIKNVLTVPVIDLALNDWVHITGVDCHRVGKRSADAMAILNYGLKKVVPPITLEKIEATSDPLNGNIEFLATFKNVVGSLRSAGRPTGFIFEESGKPGIDLTYRIELKKNTVLLKTNLAQTGLNQINLYYGFGNNPYCNITDEGDRSLPGFGPYPVYSAYAPWVTRLKVSNIQPSAGKLKGLNYLADGEGLQWTSRTFNGAPLYFCNIHPELSQRAPEDNLVYFSSDIRCGEPMQVDIMLGYDGPVKVWLDGRPVYHDPNGTNPALPDEVKIPVKLSRGNHAVRVALASNHGKAWGIFLRFRRSDVPLKLLLKGPDAYKIPEVI